jgi:hypothetical protein
MSGPSEERPQPEISGGRTTHAAVKSASGTLPPILELGWVGSSAIPITNRGPATASTNYNGERLLLLYSLPSQMTCRTA